MIKHITWVVSDLQHSHQFEGLIQALSDKQLSYSFILINCSGSQFEKFLLENAYSVTKIEVTTKINYFSSIWKCAHHFRSNKTKVVHCHLLKANLIGLFTAFLMGISQRIYTRHHSSFHHLYAPKGVFIDRIINRLATCIIAISRVTYSILRMEKVQESKLTLIPHGFDFSNIQKYLWKGLNDKAPVIGVVSRFINWKGIEFTIAAFKKLLIDFPSAILKLYGGEGPDQNEILSRLKNLPENSYEVIPFNANIYDSYCNMSIYVHVPINAEIEAYGQTYVEACAVGVPSIFTLSGIAHDFVRHEKNALVVEYRNTDAIYNAMIKIFSNRELAEKISVQARKDVLHRFDVSIQAASLKKLYM
ncbi:MAG: glycosyltransferase family 4 protein [Cyclobacteriaceae bacterium]|nr:glycosyltransferase family 4 protein [Cyclobacteriaceae bacterium]